MNKPAFSLSQSAYIQPIWSKVLEKQQLARKQTVIFFN
jgi:hypothetical protein